MQPDIGWQAGVATDNPGLAAARSRRLKVNDLGEGMNAAVGPPRAVHPDGRASDVRKTALHNILDGGDSGERL